MLAVPGWRDSQRLPNAVPVVQALIAAQKAGIVLDWDRACAIDLATKGSGKSVVEAVRTDGGDRPSEPIGIASIEFSE